MRSEVVFFQVSAFGALLLLVRHAVRTLGRGSATALFVYLWAMGIIRELIVVGISIGTGRPHPFTPDPTMGAVGGVNLAVVAGWVFTTYTSFLLARMIQKRSFAGTNVFLTLSLTALVTTAISYAVEVTGMRARLWIWEENATLLTWLPFSWPLNAFDGWAATSFVIMLLYCSVRYGLFAERAWLSLVLSVGVFALYAGSDLTVDLLGPSSPRMKLTVVYMAAATLLGFFAPRWMLGSSEDDFGPADAPAA